MIDRGEKKGDNIERIISELAIYYKVKKEIIKYLWEEYKILNKKEK